MLGWEVTKVAVESGVVQDIVVAFLVRGFIVFKQKVLTSQNGGVFASWELDYFRYLIFFFFF